MKRRHGIIKIIALLLAWVAAGATLNVAVAWGLAAYIPPGSEPGSNVFIVSQHEASVWLAEAPPGFVSQPILCSRVRGFGFEGCYITAKNPGQAIDVGADSTGRVQSMRIPTVPGITEPADHAMFVRSGWPMPALSGTQWMLGRGRGGYFEFSAVLGTASTGTVTNDCVIQYQTQKRGGMEFRLLPLRPIWPGFAVNTLFYAGVLWVLCYGPFALRRMIRRRRGQCPHCAYPIGRSPVCTECGAAVV